MVKNLNTRKDSYLRLDRSRQIGNLASELARIRSNLREGDAVGAQVAITSLEMCQYFTEWTITTLNPMHSESDLALAEELLRLGRQVTGWKHHWQSIWQDAGERSRVAVIVEQWRGQMLERSGLLQPEQG